MTVHAECFEQRRRELARNWITIDHWHFPSMPTFVLVFARANSLISHQVWEAHWDQDLNKFKTPIGGVELYDVTHFMPLPAPPI